MASFGCALLSFLFFVGTQDIVSVARATEAVPTMAQDMKGIETMAMNYDTKTYGADSGGAGRGGGGGTGRRSAFDAQGNRRSGGIFSPSEGEPSKQDLSGFLGTDLDRRARETIGQSQRGNDRGPIFSPSEGKPSNQDLSGFLGADLDRRAVQAIEEDRGTTIADPVGTEGNVKLLLTPKGLLIQPEEQEKPQETQPRNRGTVGFSGDKPQPSGRQRTSNPTRPLLSLAETSRKVLLGN